MARKKKAESGGGGCPGWMATYGDMVTLILCFFVLLYSFSTMDAKKFEAVAASMQSAFSVQPGGKTMSTASAVMEGSLRENQGDTDRPTDSDQVYNSNRVLALVQRALKDDMKSEEITVSVNDRGVVVAISEQTLFEEGSAKLRPEVLRILYKIGGVLEKLPNDISVEGHTDSGIPERSVYIDNWGLSSARASRVTAYLDEITGISQNRLRAVGMGASAPMVPNVSEENMKLNRRVDIVILSVHPVR